VEVDLWAEGDLVDDVVFLARSSFLTPSVFDLDLWARLLFSAVLGILGVLGVLGALGVLGVEGVFGMDGVLRVGGVFSVEGILPLDAVLALFVGSFMDREGF
jgi:hypothetical protein